MDDKTPNLLSPLSWDGLQSTNRVAMAPMTRARAGEQMIANDLMATYYAQRASAGILISEGTFVSPQAVGWAQAPGIWSDEQVEGWKKVTASVRGHRTPFFLQLWHTGRASHPDFLNGDTPVAPSAIKLEGDPVRTTSGEKKKRVTPRALGLEEIPRIVEDYRRAAENAMAAGFDGVEIHAANGYLIDQFLQSKTNQRNDCYGGSVENRFRFLREILEACATVWPAQRIGVRLAPNGSFNDMGSPDYRETFTYAGEQLNEFDLAWLHVVDGLKFGFHELGEPMTLQEFRGFYNGRLMGNCGYDKEAAEREIAAGHADFIAFGRPFISNPDLVERFANDWDFNEPASPDTWYSFDAEGYTDYPTYKESEESRLVESAR